MESPSSSSRRRIILNGIIPPEHQRQGNQEEQLVDFGLHRRQEIAKCVRSGASRDFLDQKRSC